METELKERLVRAIQEKVTPGAVVAVARKDGTRLTVPAGTLTYEEGSTEVTADTLYDLASITKSIPTGSLGLKLLDEGRIRLEDKLTEHLPEFNNSDRENVLVKHLLTYTLDGYGLASLGDVSAERIKEYVLSHDFARPPGTVFKYTNIPAYLLGLLIEKVTDETLDVLAEREFFKPLGMERTTYHPEAFSPHEVAPTEVEGIVHDESARIFRREGVTVGHAGVFSTAGDILTFMEMMLQGGELGGKRYFSLEIIEACETNQIPELGDSTGLGWELNQPRFMGSLCTPKTFGKTGFTGTLAVCDRERGVAFVLLTNRIHPQRPADSDAINILRADISDIIWRGMSA